MRQLEAEYAGRLVVLGIHSPKFPGERETESLRAAVERLDVRHPVANDRDFAIWRTYAVRAWPTLVFIDPQGRVIGRHEGEFDYGAMAQTIDAMLTEFMANGSLQPTADAAPTLPSRGTDRLRFPGKAIAAPDGGYAVSDTGHHRVMLLDRDGRARAVFGGPEPGMADGGPTEARFTDPQGLAWWGNELLVADTGNHALRAVDVSTGRVSTLAGNGTQGPLWSSPWDLAVVGARVIVAMAGNHRIVEWSSVHLGGHRLSGSGREGLRDGSAATAEYAQPSGLAVGEGVIYVADSETSAVRALDPRTVAVRTLVGQGLFDFGDVDGVGAAVRLQHCLGVAVHGGHVYIADAYNHRIKRLDPKTRRCTGFAGAGRSGLLDAIGTDALFSEPGGIAAADGRLLVADTNNHALRLVDPDTAEVTTLTVSGLDR